MNSRGFATVARLHALGRATAALGHDHKCPAPEPWCGTRTHRRGAPQVTEDPAKRAHRDLQDYHLAHATRAEHRSAANAGAAP